MTLKVLEVRLKNIRSHEDFTFKPAEMGITAIMGANGAGKSTITDSVSWGFFGTKPVNTGRAKDLANYNINPAKDDCYVKILFEVDGAKFEVKRSLVTKAGATECEVYRIKDKSRTLVAGPAVSHADRFIRKLLKMTEKGFLASVFVQQKQVDELILATPRERTKVIERLTGIESITTALSNSKTEANNLRKMVSVLPFDNKAVETLESEVKKERASQQNLKKRFESTKTRLDEKQADLDRLNEQKDQQGVIRDTYRDLTARSQYLKTDLEKADRQIESLKADVTKLEARLGNTRKINENQISAELEAKEQGLAVLSKEDFRLKNAQKQAREKISDAKQVLAENDGTLETDYDSLIEQGKIAETAKISDLEKNREERALAVSLRNQRENSIELIENGDGSCPTCLQPVSDHKITHTLTEDLKHLDEQVKNSEAEKSSLQAEIDEIQDRLKTWEKCLQAVNTVSEQEMVLERLREEIAKNGALLKVADLEVKALRKKHASILAKKELLESYDSAKKRLSRAVKDRNTILGDFNKNEDELSKIPNFKEQSYQKLLKKVDKSAETVSTLKTDFYNVVSEAKLGKQRLSTLRRDLENAKKQASEYEKLLESVEVAENTVNAISEFREDRMEVGIPLLENYASDLINRFSDGKFVRLELDAKLNAQVVLKDGTIRSVGLLSGGELSLASIALRIAISLMMGGQSNLLILDEVLVSQDSERAENILNTIQQVVSGQVIIIAHNGIVEAIADKVVEL